MQIFVDTPEEYLEKIPEDRRTSVSKLRNVVLDNLPEGFEEQISYGMLGYVVPHSIYPDGYYCTPHLPLPFMAIASQKNFISLYHMGFYANSDLFAWFQTEYPKHCKYKMDMGKGCVRFKKLDDIPYVLIAELTKKLTLKEWISQYENVIKK